MNLGNNCVIGLRLARSKLKDPQTIVVGAPPPPQRATLPLALAPISRKLHLGRVRWLSRKTIEVPLASKKQSPPVRGIGSGIPSTLSQQLPRESMAKCAKSVDDIFLSEAVTFPSVWFSCFMPHGAVASSLCRPKAVTCIVLKMSVIESNLASTFWTNRQNIRTPEQFSSTTKEIYSTVLMLSVYRRESLWESLKEKLQSSRVDQAAWRWRAPSCLLKKAPTFSSRAGGRSSSIKPSS